MRALRTALCDPYDQVIHIQEGQRTLGGLFVTRLGLRTACRTAAALGKQPSLATPPSLGNDDDKGTFLSRSSMLVV